MGNKFNFKKKLMKIDSKIHLQNIFRFVVRYAVMLFYVLILFLLLFHKRSRGSFRELNIVPFREITNYLFSNDIISSSFAWNNLLGNIVIFIPLGIYLPMLKRNKSILANTLIITLVSISVEIAQFIFCVGVADIDDVILNSIGGLFGTILWKILFLIFKDKTELVIDLIAPIGGGLAFLIIFLLNR